MDPSTAALIASGAFQTGKVLHSLGGKYLPGIKRVINHVFSTKSRQTAKDYVSNLRTAKGLQKAITKDLPSVVKKGANLVTSGKALKAVTNVAGDVGKVVAAVEQIPGASKYTGKVTSAISSGLGKVTHAHDVANKFLSDYGMHNRQKQIQLRST